MRPGFPKYGACELTFASEKGGLWAENFQIWGLVSWKFPNLGACERRFWWKLRLLRLKFPNFLKRGSCELTLLLEMGPLRVAGEAWKGDLQGRTSPYPLSRSVPPPRDDSGEILHSAYFIMACQSGTCSGALASTSTDSEGQALDKNTRSVWKALCNFGVFWCSFTLFSIKVKSYENIYCLSLLFLHVISVFSRWNSSNLLKIITSEKSGN